MTTDPSEFSRSGNPIYRHAPRTKPFVPALGEPLHIELIEQHLARHLGKPAWVFHEIVSDLVHLDVQVVSATDVRPWTTLVTCGMSARAMTVPEGAEEFSYAELVMALPPDWPLDQNSLQDENNYWPIRLLKNLARLPHEYDTWLALAHSVPNGDPPEPYAPGTCFCGAVLAPPILAPEGFGCLQVTPEMPIHFLAVLPLYPEEVKLKLDRGAEELFGRLDKAGVNELLDLKRKNVARKFLGLF
jgi:hypothetical protein